MSKKLGPRLKLDGKRFGMLTVTGLDGKRGNHYYWKVLCDCGNTNSVRGSHLNLGNISSCGCTSNKINEPEERRYSKNYPRLFNIYRGMRKRCYLKSDTGYRNYGGRGIKIHKEWLDDFLVFKDWAMSNGYDDSLSIDRIDNDGDYEPSNCRWVDNKTQSRNTRTNTNITYKGQTKTIIEWSEITGINSATISSRLKRNVPVEELFIKPTKRKTHIYTFNGETKTLNEWCDDIGLNISTARSRLSRGWTIERVLSTKTN